MTSPEEVATRYASRPGFRLVSYRDVALPLWELNVRCLTLVRPSLPPLEEFVLKLVAAELTHLDQVRGFLAIDEAIVIGTIGELIAGGLLSAVPKPQGEEAAFALTTKGRQALSAREQIVAEQRVFPLTYDGLVRRLVRPITQMLKPREVRQQALTEIPAFPADPPEQADLAVTEVSALARAIARAADLPRDILTVLGIEGLRRRVFQQAVALIYEPVTSGSEYVAFAIDGRVSEEHGEAFATAEGTRKMGIARTLRERAVDVAASVLPAGVLDRTAPEEEVDLLRQASGTLREVVADLRARATKAKDSAEQEAVQSQLVDTSERLSRSEAALAGFPVRNLQVYEHRAMFDDAFEQAVERLLVVSPWIRSKVVDATLLKRIQGTLDRGVAIYIGYGVGEDQGAGDSDRRAEEALLLMSRRRPNLHVGRLGDTHAKVLLVDSKFLVVTSFNWLSFLGAPDRPFRDERGLLVTIPETIEEVFGSLAPRIVEASNLPA